MSFWTRSLSKRAKSCDERCTFAIPIMFCLNVYSQHFSVKNYLILHAKQNSRVSCHKQGSEMKKSIRRQNTRKKNKTVLKKQEDRSLVGILQRATRAEESEGWLEFRNITNEEISQTRNRVAASLSQVKHKNVVSMSQINTKNRPSEWLTLPLSLSVPSVDKGKIQQKFPNFVLQNFGNKYQHLKVQAEGFYLNVHRHQRILSTDSKVRTALRDSNIYSGSERLKRKGNLGDVSEGL